MEIGLEPAGAGLRLEPQRMLAPAGDPIVDIGAKAQRSTLPAALDRELDREKRRVLDDEAAFLDRRHQKILVVLPFEDGGEQLHQRRPPDRGPEIEPGAVGGDAHVEIAAERRIPQVDRRRPLAGGFARGAREGVQTGPCLGVLRHGVPRIPAYRWRISAAPPTGPRDAGKAAAGLRTALSHDELRPGPLPFVRHGLPGTCAGDRPFPSDRERRRAFAARAASADRQSTKVQALPTIWSGRSGSRRGAIVADLFAGGVAPSGK